MENNKPRFDPTINLGHILTFLGFITTGIGAYWTLDKRLSVLEERAMLITSSQREQAATVKESVQEIKQDVRDMRKAIELVSADLLRRSLRSEK